ncbi:hypothetical protein [Haliea sp.]|jgi:hypothetical protein|uniref:hypothetical protein n=1 Tax=Haliea sp. TaxID=1932666 RepID=UPI00257CC8C3|nr:hypothetical protein [Haliea sp.]
MSWKESNRIFIFLLGVAGGFFLVDKCSAPTVITNTEIEYKWDTIQTEVSHYVPKPVPYPVEVVRWDTFKTSVDTAFILKDYFSKIFYRDSIVQDSVSIIIEDTVTRNRIVSRYLNYTLRYPTKIVTNEVYVPKNEYFYGAQLVSGREGFAYIGPELSLKTKTNNLYQFGIGINNQLAPVISLSINWKF